jgi:hypothetical protein
MAAAHDPGRGALEKLFFTTAGFFRGCGSAIRGLLVPLGIIRLAHSIFKMITGQELASIFSLQGANSNLGKLRSQRLLLSR